MNKRNEEAEIDLLELFFVLLRHWKLECLAGIVFAAAFWAYSTFMISPVYSSTSVLYVLSESTSITSIADIQVGTYLTKDYVEVITYRSVLEQVLKNLKLDEAGMTYRSLGARVRVANPDSSRLIKITVSDTDPKRAKQIADEMAEVSRAYIAQSMNQEAPNLIQKGYIAVSPDSPNVQKNTMMGGLLGLILIMGLETILYLLNDTIMTAEELERKTGMTMLAAVPVMKMNYDHQGDRKSLKKKPNGTKQKKVRKKA